MATELPIRYVPPIANLKTLAAVNTASLSSVTVIYTAPARTETKITHWTSFYSGSDAGALTWRVFLRSPAAVDYQMFQAAVALDYCVEWFSDGSVLVLEPGWAVAISSSAAVGMDNVITGIEESLPS